MSVEAPDDAWQPGQIRERFYAYVNALLHPRSGALAPPVQTLFLKSSGAHRSDAAAIASPRHSAFSRKCQTKQLER